MTFQTFTGKEYLKIDIANSFGHDKMNWDDRIAWFDANEDRLHDLVKVAEEPALFYAGVKAWEATKAGKPSSYPISLDATCSGIQLLATMSGDRGAASLCNVVDVGHREDAYTTLYHRMVDKIGDSAKITRKDTKKAIMTAFYGSTAQPKEIFGEGELLEVFYQTMKESAPGAWEINEAMLAVWDDKALNYDWVLPDNFHVKIKVMGTVEDTVHFLNQPFSVTYKKNRPVKDGRSLGANMVHSLDGMIVREMSRRCMYDFDKIQELKRLIHVGAAGRSKHKPDDQMVSKLWAKYLSSGFLSARILDHLTIDNLGLVDHFYIKKLLDSLPKKPFSVISVHDCFRCLPNYGNDLRRQYNNLLAEIAESDMLSFIVSQIVKRPIRINKIDTNMSHDIREANYALS